MGDWGYKAYENDEAADWFTKFWKSKNFDLLQSTAANFDPKNENYDEIRAAAHVLPALAHPMPARRVFWIDCDRPFSGLLRS
ncbi:DUF4259 domain-containing protein [Campylobacter sp.]|uniref:DUF4259 domain-containing protein n=1 Tax=Campylobacter sp. TaxID=205 RepID=UPI0025B91892|nr:DUF4259 domain-containing protein [Campylobacter sp.]